MPGAFWFCAALATATGLAQEKPAARVADLAWLAGTGRGTLANGATFEAHYSDAAGATTVSASKEQQTYIFARPHDETLIIRLRGPGQDGVAKEIRYGPKRAPASNR